MVVHVHLHTILGKQTDGKIIRHVDLDLPAGTDLQAVLQILEITLEEKDILLVVNHRTVTLEQMLNDGDKVDLIPRLSGG